jgi:pantetheine-phosphate adenylyltransferase
MIPGDLLPGSRRYRRVATGGTFDRLHRGHASLLEKSFEVGDEVVIGVTSDEFARRMGKNPEHRYEERVKNLEELLRRRFPGRRYTIAELHDYFGPGIASPEVQALVASEETAGRLELANKLRRERGFPPLDLVVVDLLMAEDAKPISSTRIRNGEIDEEGRALRTPRGRKGI